MSVYTRPCSAAVLQCHAAPHADQVHPSTQPPLQQPIRKRVWSIFLEVSFYPLHIQYSQCQFACTEVVVRCGGAWCSNVLPGDNSRSFSDPYHLSPIQARFLISFKWCSFKLATSSCARWGNHRQRVSHLRHVTWLLLTCHASRVTISVISCQLSSVTRNIFPESQMGNFPHHFTSFGYGQRRSFQKYLKLFEIFSLLSAKQTWRPWCDQVTKWPTDQITGWQDERKLRRRLTGWYICIRYIIRNHELMILGVKLYDSTAWSEERHCRRVTAVCFTAVRT